MKSIFTILSFLSFIIMIIGLIKPALFQKVFKNHKLSRLKIFGLTIILIILFSGLSEINYTKTSDIELVTTDNSVGYEIIQKEDMSRKAMGNKSLSDFSSSELASLPMDKKIKYQVLVSKGIKENNIEPTVNKIIKDITAKDGDIDEIILWLYSDKGIIESNGAYDIASAVWAPFGELGHIDADVATSNNRINYSIKIDAKNNLNEYLSQKGSVELKFGLTEEQRRQLYKEIVAIEDKSRAEADKLFQSDYSKNKAKFLELRSKYIITVLEKYNINETQEKEITNEGLRKSWPLD